MELLYKTWSLLATLTLLSAKASGQESKAICPINEVYSSCVIPCNDCEIKGNCAFIICNEGCDCLPGYYRDQNGVCIPEEFCPSGGVCLGRNEVYKTCGPACTKTCDNKHIRIACIDECVKGCFCRDGYVRDKKGNCILPSQCPPKVCPGKNEEYRDCKIECPRTCDNYDKEIACTQDCVPGCYCKKGYVRDINGNCILPSQCPPQVQCLPNEEYSDCGSYCEPSCQTKGGIMCPAVCVPGCFCKRGFIRFMDPIHGVKAPCVRKYMCPFYI